MKQLIFITLLLFCCLQAKAQEDYLKIADECFEKGDYECAKKNYTLFQTWDGRDMSAQIQKTDECMRTLNLADDYFKEKEYGKAKERYKIVLDKNPKDPHARKLYDFCEGYLPEHVQEEAEQKKNVKTVPRVSTNAKFKLGASLGGQTFDYHLCFGGSISGEYLVTPKTGIGLNVGYYKDNRNYFSFNSVTLTGKYYFLTKSVQPYGGVDIGSYGYEEVFSFHDVYLSFVPVVGLQFKLSETLELNINAKYDILRYISHSNDVFGFNIGFVYTFGK